MHLYKYVAVSLSCRLCVKKLLFSCYCCQKVLKEVSNCDLTPLETRCASQRDLSEEEEPFIMLANVSAKIS